MCFFCRPLLTVLCLGARQYGKDYDYDAPVKLLDKLLHSMSQSDDEQLVVVSQVLALSHCNLDFVLHLFRLLRLVLVGSWTCRHCGCYLF